MKAHRGIGSALCLVLGVWGDFVHAAEPAAAYGAGSALPADTIATLEYFPRWETPIDSDAHKAHIRLRKSCPDFASFEKEAPPGSETRKLIFRFWDSFEDAARLIRAGTFNESIFFNAWYDVPPTWKKDRPWVEGLRAESGNPRLYADFEWLAGRAEAFWAEWNKVPHPPRPLERAEPSAADRAVFETYDRVSPRTPAEWQFLEELRRNGPTFEDFRRMVPDGDPRFSTFDWLLCYYGRAAILIEDGILHPKLLFDSPAWRSPAELWAICGPWIIGLRVEKKIPDLYSDFEWLAGYEKQWRERRTLELALPVKK